MGEPAKRKFCSFLSGHTSDGLKMFSAVITSQDLSFDTKFGRLKCRDAVPLNENRISNVVEARNF